MPINLEGEMFEPVKNYIIKICGCPEYIETFGHDSHEGVPSNTGWLLKINEYCSNPDVYGMGRDRIYLCQGKLIKNAKGKLWEVIGQAISNRNYCDYLYIFFEKEYWEKKIEKNDSYRQDFEAILKQFNIGLLLINNELQVEETIQAEAQDAPKKNINETRQKIYDVTSSSTIKEFFNNIFENLKKSGKEVHYLRKTYLKQKQPAYYIYLDEWQKDMKLGYFIKFLQEKVLVGISASPELMQGEFPDRLLKNERFNFTEYNQKTIDATNFKKEEKKTQEFHESIQLNQSATDFFSDINSKKSEKVILQVNEILKEIVEKIDTDFLKELVKF